MKHHKKPHICNLFLAHRLCSSKVSIISLRTQIISKNMCIFIHLHVFLLYLCLSPTCFWGIYINFIHFKNPLSSSLAIASGCASKVNTSVKNIMKRQEGHPSNSSNVLQVLLLLVSGSLCIYAYTIIYTYEYTVYTVVYRLRWICFVDSIEWISKYHIYTLIIPHGNPVISNICSELLPIS